MQKSKKMAIKLKFILPAHCVSSIAAVLLKQFSFPATPFQTQDLHVKLVSRTEFSDSKFTDS
jgi:hypothetical protein